MPKRAPYHPGIDTTTTTTTPTKTTITPGSEHPLGPWVMTFAEKFDTASTLCRWAKEDPPTQKQLPVEVDVPEYLASMATLPLATPLDQAIRDLALIAFYYLLRIGEYTSKGRRNESKQTVQFKFEDITFFKKNWSGDL